MGMPNPLADIKCKVWVDLESKDFSNMEAADNTRLAF